MSKLQASAGCISTFARRRIWLRWNTELFSSAKVQLVQPQPAKLRPWAVPESRRQIYLDYLQSNTRANWPHRIPCGPQRKLQFPRRSNGWGKEGLDPKNSPSKPFFARLVRHGDSGKTSSKTGWIWKVHALPGENLTWFSFKIRNDDSPCIVRD